MQLGWTEFDSLRKIILERSGIVVDHSKQTFIEQRLMSVAESNGFDSLKKFFKQHLNSAYSRFVPEVIEAVTDHETTFFRDMSAFRAIKEKVLPDLIQRRAKERTLNIWSGACATGQEVFSVALMIREHFPELRDWNIRFVATDISKSILIRAREGRFEQLEVNRGLPAPMLLKYFDKHGLEWQLKSEIRSKIEFRELNLIKSWPPMPKMDIIFLRNVLMYFEPEQKKKILHRVADQLRDDGYMVLGIAEIPMTADHTFAKLDHPRSGCFTPRQKSL